MTLPSPLTVSSDKRDTGIDGGDVQAPTKRLRRVTAEEAEPLSTDLNLEEQNRVRSPTLP